MTVSRTLLFATFVVAAPFAAYGQFGGMPGMPGGMPGGGGGFGGPPQQGPPPACRELLAMRDEVQKHGTAIQKANEKKAPVQEACKLFKNFLSAEAKFIKSLGVRAGVALNPATPVIALEQIAGDVDYVLVMTVNPGFGGQTFIPRSESKVRAVRELLRREGSVAPIEVDGGGIGEVQRQRDAQALTEEHGVGAGGCRFDAGELVEGEG